MLRKTTSTRSTFHFLLTVISWVWRVHERLRWGRHFIYHLQRTHSRDFEKYENLLRQWYCFFLFFCREYAVLFIKSQDNKLVSGFSQTQRYCFLMTTCFGHLTTIWPALQNLENVFAMFVTLF